MAKIDFKGKEGRISGRGFHFLGAVWFFLKSETKWHKGGKNLDKWIWVDKIKDEIPALFVGKVAIGYRKDKEKGED